MLWLISVFLLFLVMVIYANEDETKEIYDSVKPKSLCR